MSVVVSTCRRIITMSADDMPAVSRRRFLNACRRAGSRICRRAHRSLLPAGCDNGGADRGRPTSRPAANSPTRSWKPFKTRRLVGLGEAHGLQNYHDVLGMLLSDPRVPEVVDDIVVEFGNALYQPMMDRFISGPPVGNADLRPTWRDTTQSPAGTWDQPVYEQFFRTVRAASWALPPGRQIRVLGDPPIDWSKITNFSQLRVFRVRGRTAQELPAPGMGRS